MLITTLKEQLANKGNLEQMGLNGCKIIQESYSKEVVVGQYISLIKEILK